MEAWVAQHERGTEQNRPFIFLFIVLVVRGGFKSDLWKFLRFSPNRLYHQFLRAQLVLTLSSFKEAVFVGPQQERDGTNNTGLSKTEEVYSRKGFCFLLPFVVTQRCWAE